MIAHDPLEEPIGYANALEAHRNLRAREKAAARHRSAE
jgi:hypothetical protein